MKLFSRKALVAVATSVAVTAGAMTAPAMAEDVAPQQNSTVTTNDNAGDGAGAGDNDTTQPSENMSSGSSDVNGKLDATEIGKWIGIIGTVLSVLTTMITLATKINTLFK